MASSNFRLTSPSQIGPLLSQLVSLIIHKDSGYSFLDVQNGKVHPALRSAKFNIEFSDADDDYTIRTINYATDASHTTKLRRNPYRSHIEEAAESIAAWLLMTYDTLRPNDGE